MMLSRPTGEANRHAFRRSIARRDGGMARICVSGQRFGVRSRGMFYAVGCPCVPAARNSRAGAALCEALAGRGKKNG